MAYITQPHTNNLPNIRGKISGFFAALGRAMTASAAMNVRLQRAEKLNAKSDEELAAMNLRREDITAYVFRDLMHI